MVNDMEALFGTDFMKSYTSETPKNEIARKESENFTMDELRREFINETRDVVSRSKEAVCAALEQAIMAPGEGESVSAIASLVNAHSKLIENYNKVFMFEEKHNQAKELLQMKLSTQTQMNAENNATKTLTTREMIMAQLASLKNQNIVDIRPSDT